jgi:hypothetical protein
MRGRSVAIEASKSLTDIPGVNGGIAQLFAPYFALSPPGEWKETMP